MDFAHKTLNCRGRLVDLSRPCVMGVLNLTPDSFYDGGKWSVPEAAFRQAEQMLQQGALFIDIGGASSRPGAAGVGPDEELRRVVPVIEGLITHFPDIFISIDTVHAPVAKEAWERGAALINDISAGTADPALLPLIADLQAPYVLMHMKGTPQSMQENPVYESEAELEILDFFIEKIGQLRALGVKDIILDPGFGFGKTLDDNYRILKNMHVFQILGLPVLAGISRKSMVYKIVGGNPEHALNGTTALHMVALQQGARILRAHDVGPAMEVIRLWEQLERQP